MYLKFPSLLSIAGKTGAKIYKDCSELSISIFFRIIETGDLNLLCISGKATEDKLRNAWERILFEFETLTGSNDYRMQLREGSEDVKRVNRINALIALYYISALGYIDITEDMKYWSVSGKDHLAVKLEILREKTKLNIETIEKKKSNGEKFDFIDLWTAVENRLHRNIDVDNCSVKKWYSICRSLEQEANQYKKLNNG